MTDAPTLANLDITLVGDGVEVDPSNPYKVGSLVSSQEVAVGVVSSPDYQGLILIFPFDNTALLFKGSALERLVGSIDYLIQAGVQSELDAGNFGEGLPAPYKKVTLH